MEEFEQEQEQEQETRIALEDIRVGMSGEQKARALAEIQRVLREGR